MGDACQFLPYDSISKSDMHISLDSFHGLQSGPCSPLPIFYAVWYVRFRFSKSSFLGLMSVVSELLSFQYYKHTYSVLIQGEQKLCWWRDTFQPDAALDLSLPSFWHNVTDSTLWILTFPFVLSNRYTYFFLWIV